MVFVLCAAMCAQAALGMRMNHVASVFNDMPCVNQNLANIAQTNIGQGHLTISKYGPVFDNDTNSNQIGEISRDRVDLTVTQSFDPSTSSLFQSIGMDAPGQPHVAQSVVFDLAAKMLTIKMDKEGKRMSKCIRVELPAFITMFPMEVLTKYANTLRNEMLDCEKNVDGNDVFKAMFPPSYVSLEAAQQLPVTWVYTVSAAADGLKKSEKMLENIKGKDSGDVDGIISGTSVDYQITYSDGSLEGPSADQLDTSEWGLCKKVKIGATEADLDRFLKHEGALAVGILNQYLRAAQSLEQNGLAAAVAAGEAMKRAWGR